MTEDEMVGWHHGLNGHEFGCGHTDNSDTMWKKVLQGHYEY